MIFLIGSGSRRTSVGTARIWSPRASCRLFEEIDDLDLIAAQQVLLAKLLQVREGQNRLRRLFRDVEPERVGLPCQATAWSACVQTTAWRAPPSGTPCSTSSNAPCAAPAELSRFNP